MININPDSPNVVVISPDNTNVTVTSVGLQGPRGEVPSTGAYTGSFSGSFVGDGAQLVNVTASGQIDSSSYATFAVSSSYATTASFALNVPDTASYALTASFALNVPDTASYALTASYIDYSGIDNLPTLVSGSSQITIGDTTGNLLGNRISGPVSDAVNATSASYAITASYAISASVEIIKEVSSSYADTASYVELAQTASIALTSSYNENPVVSGSITGPDYIDFNTGVTPPHTEGRLFYDQSNGALGFYNEEADITLQIGQEFYKRVYNNSGNPIANGTPVRISGSQGDVPYIWPAFSKNIYSGSYDAQENKIIGLATHTIEDNSVGYVTEFGVVRGVNTTTFAAGDQLFLQTGSAGFRNTPPPFPFDIIPVGEVIRSQANGFIEVRTAEPITSENVSGIINIETEVISDETTTIQKGTPVHVVSEGNGPIPRVKIAKASDSNLMPATFVVEEDILSGSQGTALSVGYIYDVDTSTFTVGDVIFVAPDGGYTNQKPTGSNLIQNLGVVLKVDAIEGSGFVYGSGRSNDVPNIQQGYFWVGNADGVATATSTGSLSSGSFSGSFQGDGSGLTNLSADPFPYTGSALISGSLEVTGSVSILSGSITIGDENENIVLGIGASSLNDGGTNIIIGKDAGNPQSPAYSMIDNIVIGKSAKSLRGADNILIGELAGSNSTTGICSDNIGIGGRSLININGGDYNVGIGRSAGDSITTGTYNILLGFGSDVSDATGNYQIAIGRDAISKGAGTTVIGSPGNTTHTYLEGIITGSSLEVSQGASGSFSGSFQGDGSGLTNISDFPYTGSALISGSLEVTGSVSILSGSMVLRDEFDNITIGEGSTGAAPTNGLARENIVIGKNSGNPADLSVDKIGNVIIGNNIKMTRGGNSVVIGKSAMANAGTNGSNSNVAIGAFAMQLNNGGSSNVAIGYSTATSISSGDNNVFIGSQSGPSAGTDNYSIVIGSAITGKGSNTTLIGKPGTTTHTYLEGIITGSTVETDTLTSKGSRFITPGILTGSSATTTVLTGSDFDNEVIRCIYTGSAGTHTITLPLAESTEGLNRQIKFVTDSTINASNIIEVVPSGSQTLNGNPSASLDTAYESLTIWSDGVEWFQL